MDVLCPLRIRRDSPLVHTLLLKKLLLQKHDPGHRKYKTALIIEGGIMYGVYGGGVVTGLEEAGMSEVFDYVIGGSAGSGIGAYFLSHQARLGTSIFYDDLIDNRFINYLRPKKIVNLDYLEEVFRNKKPLDQKTLRKSRSTCFISVTNAKTGEGELLNAKDPDIDIISLIKASCALPVLYNQTVTIKGKEYCDGLIGIPYAIEYAIRELQCTDVLVITNKTCDCQTEIPVPPLVERMIAKTYLRGESERFRKAFISREGHYRHDMGYLWQEERVPQVNLGLICRNKMPMSMLTRDRKKLKQVAREAEEQTEHLFR